MSVSLAGDVKPNLSSKAPTADTHRRSQTPTGTALSTEKNMKQMLTHIGVFGMALGFLSTVQAQDMDELGRIEKQLTQLSEDPEPKSAPGGNPEAIFHGFVFLNGRYMSPPYVLQWNGNTMTINNVRVPITAEDAGNGERWLARCEQRLRNDMLLISIDGEPAQFVEPDWAIRILGILINNDTWPVKIETLVKSGCEQFHSGHWTMLVERFRATAEIEERVAALQERLETPRPQAAGRSTATVLTAFSMALAMIGFATIVNFRPGESISAARGCRLVFRCVALLVVFNLFDLFCTMTPFRAGTLWELNPLAASPAIPKTDVLVAFKASLTILPATLLLALRHYRIAQLASWWACLLYTVLIFRWTAFNSLFLN